MPASGLTNFEKVRIRYHLGYPMTAMAASVQLGVFKPVQTAFLLEDAFNLLIDPDVITIVQGLIATMDSLDAQILCAAPSLSAAKVGDIELHPLKGQGKLATDSLRKEYVEIGHRLADVVGCPIYPYAMRYQRSGPGTSIPVR
jgi:hypothetical protein